MSLSVPDFSAVKVLVVGDLMLDQYWFGPTARISPEAPVPVVRVTEAQGRPGGAANVAVNLASLGTATVLTGILGQDANGDTLQRLVESHGIEFDGVRSATQPTITKLRVLSRNQQLIRLDTENPYSPADIEPVYGVTRKHIVNADVCIFSDYAKGSLGQVQQLISLCREHDVTVLVDPKGTDFERYRGADLLTPNFSEFEAVAGPVSGDEMLIERAQSLLVQLELKAMLVTLGERGMLVVSESGPALLLPARAREVFDVTGAGDTVIAALAAGLGSGMELADAAGLANLAAGLVVRKIGVASVTPSELRLALHEYGQGGRGLVDRDEACRVAEEARSRGERVVMTNGCFDILHTGHVAYLEEAKTLGDRLIVAVNDDASVADLKGEGRPVNPLEDRMGVLAGLASVDWVVPFSEETPEQLVKEILPDVLVKGGDYQVDEIAGGRAVLENGGSVKVLGFREGRSTSAIIQAISKLTS